MKILKIRRGYTTNSSAASEFIPPDAEVALVPVNKPAATQPPPPQAQASSKTATEPRQASPASVRAPITRLAPVPLPQNSITPATPPAIQPPPAKPQASAEHADTGAAPAQNQATPNTDSKNTHQSTRHSDNTWLIATLAGLVGLVFFVDKVIRRIFRRRKDGD